MVIPTAPCSVSTAAAEASPGKLEVLAIPENIFDGSNIRTLGNSFVFFVACFFAQVASEDIDL